MPKGNGSVLTYKISVVGDEPKIVFYGLMSPGYVQSPSNAVKSLRDGKPFVYIHARQADKTEFEKLWTG